MKAKDILINKQSFAVIGVTNNQDKYGYKIFKRLNELNKTVYGISPIYKDIEGTPAFPNLTVVNKTIDVAVFVVSPKYGYDYVKECVDLGIHHIWLQPGTYDEQLISLIKEAGINYYQNCVLVESQDM